MRFLPTYLHGIVDYLWGVVLIAAPWLFGFADGGAAQWSAVAIGIGAILFSFVTDYELSLARLLPMPLYLAVDGVGGLFLALSPWLFDFADRVYLPHLIFGLFAVAASLFTRLDPSQPSRIRHG